MAIVSCYCRAVGEERWRGAMATRDGERVLLVSCLISQIISLCACFRMRILPGLGTNCTYSIGSAALGECNTTLGGYSQGPPRSQSKLQTQPYLSILYTCNRGGDLLWGFNEYSYFRTLLLKSMIITVAEQEGHHMEACTAVTCYLHAQWFNIPSPPTNCLPKFSDLGLETQQGGNYRLRDGFSFLFEKGVRTTARTPSWMMSIVEVDQGADCVWLVNLWQTRFLKYFQITPNLSPDMTLACQVQNIFLTTALIHLATSAPYPAKIFLFFPFITLFILTSILRSRYLT